MNRKHAGNSYEFVGIRDRGDNVIGPRDRIVLKDSNGGRHEFYLGDEQSQEFLKSLGTSLQEIEGLSLGQAQGKLSYLHHMMLARRMQENGGHVDALDEELRQAENSARMADQILGPYVWKEIHEMRERLHH